VSLTEIVGDRGAADRIGADHGNKFVADGLAEGRFIARNKQIDRWSIELYLKA
jgi:hypothetical protein